MASSYYIDHVRQELAAWQRKMQREPTMFSRLSKRAQVKINSYIPEKVHVAITAAIRQMIRGVLFGVKTVTASPAPVNSIELTETVIREKIECYKKTAAAEGGITGAGGILLSFADFPILIGIKNKMLFDIAASYGFDVKDYRERV